ncbi:MAG TPA: c-type cytochrome domain-containing protein, partial [Candidatus Solibacter sp.]|nr:c-type cytochrome domain-containing protein [Candidatus Solibacter sp.]
MTELTLQRIVRAILIMLPTAISIRADSVPQTVSFNRDIRPILSDKCFTCHGPDAANRKSKLRFDHEEGARIDLGKGSFAMVPGEPAKSELYLRITSNNPALRMPPA